MQMILSPQPWTFPRLLAYTTSWLSFLASAWLFVFTLEYRYLFFAMFLLLIVALSVNWPNNNE